MKDLFRSEWDNRKLGYSEGAGQKSAPKMRFDNSFILLKGPILRIEPVQKQFISQIRGYEMTGINY